jgi:hypothetical protein
MLRSLLAKTVVEQAPNGLEPGQFQKCASPLPNCCFTSAALLQAALPRCTCLDGGGGFPAGAGSGARCAAGCWPVLKGVEVPAPSTAAANRAGQAVFTAQQGSW